ncbi:sickle tail protein homolog, partial [Cololabis saira]|uniref:sickle tail protein homolog n=1 Tax=Cololabis saira TaxID=129043 RepID=UPI002AD3A68D
MCDGDLQLQPFLRGCRARASLPGAQSHCHTQRMLGVLYLQYGEETMQVQMPPEISSLDSVRALFVLAFPHQLTMKMLQSPNMAICIRDTGRHLYYDLDDLDDLRNVASHSFLKAYHRDPVQMFHTRPAGTERRISKEVLYGSLGLVQNCSLGLVQNCSALHALQGSMSPPTVRSMPSSPSRIAAHGGDRRRAPGPGSATLPRQRLSEGGRSMSSSSCSILERRDVRPDGGRPESYSSSGHLGRSSSRASPPPSTAPELVPGILGGLQQYKASVRPLVGYVVPQNRTLLRQKSMRPGDVQLPVETGAPPLSPHRAADVRMIDGRGPGGGASPEKMSSLPVSLRRDSNGVKMPNRRSCSSSSNSSVFVDSPLGLWVQTHEQGSNDHSERMKAMEQQIASLTGLVHQVLSLGSDAPGLQDRLREQNLLNGRAGGSARTQSPPAWIDSSGPAPPALQAPPTGSGVQQGLELVRRRLDELRLELSRLRCLQLSHLESVGSMLRMAGQELVVLLWDWLVQSQQTEERRRLEVEDDIAHYLTQEERILSQLRELEDFVARRRGPAQVTLAEVEEAAVGLQRVGERLVVLRGDLPPLQRKMRSALRLELEVVRFLGEEPPKMDAMLKRVRGLMETLGGLRRQVLPPGTEPQRAQQQGPPKTWTPQDPPTPSPPSPASLRQAGVSVVPLPLRTVPHGRASPAAEASPGPEGSGGRNQNQNQNQDQDQDRSRTESSPGTVPVLHESSLPPLGGSDPVSGPSASTESRSELDSGLDPLQDDPSAASPVENRSNVDGVRNQSPDGSNRSNRSPPQRIHAATGLTSTPSGGPTSTPSGGPTSTPSGGPTSTPSGGPTSTPSGGPTSTPSGGPTSTPSGGLTSTPSGGPTSTPSGGPTSTPSGGGLVSSCQEEPAGSQADREKAAPHPKPPRHAEGKASSRMFGSDSISKTNAAPGEEQEVDEQGSTKDLKVSTDCTGRVPVGNVQVGIINVGQKKVEDIEGLSSLNQGERSPPAGLQSGTTLVKPDGSEGPVSQEHVLLTKEADGHLLSPTSREKPTMFPTVGENIQTLDTVLQKVRAQKSSLTLVVTLQKENPSKDDSFQQNKSQSSNQDQKPPTPVLKPTCVSPSLTSNTSTHQNQDRTSRNQSTEDGGNLNPVTMDDEGPPPPPPPPPIGDRFIHRISKTSWKNRTDPDESDGSVNGDGGRLQDYDDMEESATEPVTVYLDQDLQDAFRRLSTVFECDEDLNPSADLDVETNGEQEEPDLKKAFDKESGRIETYSDPRPPETGSSVPAGRNSETPETGSSVPAVPGQQTLKKVKARSKFKFRFPKTKLAALSQVIRLGTKKTTKVTRGVVPEDQETPRSNVVPEDQETPRSNVVPEDQETPRSNVVPDDQETPRSRSRPRSRVQALCRDAFDSINSLEESIKQLEISVDSITSSSGLGSP